MKKSLAKIIAGDFLNYLIIIIGIKTSYVYNKGIGKNTGMAEASILHRH